MDLVKGYSKGTQVVNYARPSSVLEELFKEESRK